MGDDEDVVIGVGPYFAKSKPKLPKGILKRPVEDEGEDEEPEVGDEDAGEQEAGA